MRFRLRYFGGICCQIAIQLDPIIDHGLEILTAFGIMILMLTYLRSSNHSLYGICSGDSSHSDADEIHRIRQTNTEKGQMTMI